jgi:hypothetical protein
VPRGANLVRLAALPMIGGGTVRYHSTFNVRRYDASRMEAALSEMRDLGYNTVRVFLDGNCREECIGDEAGGLNPAYIANLADFLERAQAHGIVVLLTSDSFPATDEYKEILNSTWSEDFVGGNAHFLKEGGIQADIHFMQELIGALREAGAPLEVIFAYQLRNELFFGYDAPPFSLESGVVMTANGESYDMALDSDKERMLEDGLIYWFDRVRAAILELDPTALVTVGFMVPQEPHPARIGDPRFIETERYLRESSADFFDLHLYPGIELTLDQYVDNFKMEGVQDRPVLMGEFGAASVSYATAGAAAQVLHDWQVKSCSHGFDGWLHWTWDTAEDPNFYHGQSGGGLMNRALAPSERPNPCEPGSFSFFETNLALGAEVRASGVLSGEPPENAVNGQTSDRWGAGAPPTQWIEIDLGSPKVVGRIRMTTSQSPPGRTVHQLWVGPSREALTLVHAFDEHTEDMQSLVFEPEAALEQVRFLRVVTTLSPSWVGWREIEVLTP